MHGGITQPLLPTWGLCVTEEGRRELTSGFPRSLAALPVMCECCFFQIYKRLFSQKRVACNSLPRFLPTIFPH